MVSGVILPQEAQRPAATTTSSRSRVRASAFRRPERPGAFSPGLLQPQSLASAHGEKTVCTAGKRHPRQPSAPPEKRAFSAPDSGRGSVSPVGCSTFSFRGFSFTPGLQKETSRRWGPSSFFCFFCYILKFNSFDFLEGVTYSPGWITVFKV